MSRIRAALLLLLIQLALVSSIAAKYLYERRTCPRVWSRATQYDPNLPLRERYLALQLLVDACRLPRDSAHFQRFMPYGIRPAPKHPVIGRGMCRSPWQTAISSPCFRIIQRIRGTQCS
jgi:hypothetical protein